MHWLQIELFANHCKPKPEVKADLNVSSVEPIMDKSPAASALTRTMILLEYKKNQSKSVFGGSNNPNNIMKPEKLKHKSDDEVGARDELSQPQNPNQNLVTIEGHGVKALCCLMGRGWGAVEMEAVG
ncbi:hypothetical protein LIER_28590 [Lithospermum erythrorhizon]|uniref:Uncharacterized protein n=1 Tax=Lithospermum erythrorhizon TaxID=34254 RepID=A0AAV3RJH3_LITER